MLSVRAVYVLNSLHLASLHLASRPFKMPGLAGVVKTPEKKHESASRYGHSPLPAHLGDVVRDLGHFFLELFPILRP